MYKKCDIIMDRKPTTQTLFAVVQVLVLLISPVAATAPTTAPQSAGQSSLSDDVEPADAIYVMENGDAVPSMFFSLTCSRMYCSLEGRFPPNSKYLYL